MSANSLFIKKSNWIWEWWEICMWHIENDKKKLSHFKHERSYAFFSLNKIFVCKFLVAQLCLSYTQSRHVVVWCLDQADNMHSYQNAAGPKLFRCAPSHPIQWYNYKLRYPTLYKVCTKFASSRIINYLSTPLRCFPKLPGSHLLLPLIRSQQSTAVSLHSEALWFTGVLHNL